MNSTLIPTCRTLALWLTVPSAVLLQACAQTPPPPKRSALPPPPLQFLVYAQPGSAAKTLAPDALLQQASRIAEVPVRHEGVGPDGRHNLVLVCADLPTCQAATQRLRVQPEYFAAVQEAPRAAFGPSNAKR
ncbi:MAG: hypothetical protein HEQ39_19495 [Rhizobacter sp.]